MRLRGITMQVHKGEIFGLLGPNGAGKSTLVKIMMTVVKPTRVKGTMLDHAIGHKPTLARVGYLPEHHRMPQYLTGGQALHFYGALGGVDQGGAQEALRGAAGGGEHDGVGGEEGFIVFQGDAAADRIGAVVDE
jgi:ABC-type multidrug transport system ATPase subunit